MCEEEFKKEEVDIDHIKPIVSLKDGFNDWNDYINSLFCPVEGFQILCKTCHDVKTKIEDTMRMKFKYGHDEFELEETDEDAEEL